MIAASLVDGLAQRGWSLALAESCTGGLIASAVTGVPGSSAVFGIGIVSYSYAAKEQLLGVPSSLLLAHGAVSEPCVVAMLDGVSKLSQATLCAAVTGIAGPGGATPDKSVGTVWTALSHGSSRWVRVHQFDGDRSSVREQTVEAVLKGLSQVMEGVAPW